MYGAGYVVKTDLIYVRHEDSPKEIFPVLHQAPLISRTQEYCCPYCLQEHQHPSSGGKAHRYNTKHHVLQTQNVS